MEELLGSSGGGLVPASVRQKDNNIIVRLADPADLLDPSWNPKPGQTV
jgi:hypothetical protein